MIGRRFAGCTCFFLVFGRDVSIPDLISRIYTHRAIGETKAVTSQYVYDAHRIGSLVYINQVVSFWNTKHRKPRSNAHVAVRLTTHSL